ncbi:MAG: M48 family metallopeptidase [Chloroflexi bacterium]|nr:M48 family metallopeptidase [Chloroflexota bacterium]
MMVTLPLRAPERWAEELVRGRAAWIRHHSGRVEDQLRRLAARPGLGDGRMLHLCGVAHQIVVEMVEPLTGRRARGRVVHEPAERLILVQLAPGDERPLGWVLERWLRGEARRVIEERTAAFAPRLGVRPQRVTVRDQRSRWGSASRRGTLSFNWRLVLAPPHVLDYVVIHELAHLADYSHSAAFWRSVRALAPEADEARRWLRSHGSELRAALD